MPFTFSHPAMVLPLCKSKHLSPTALIIGSCSPDFEMFIRFDLIKTFSHNFWAMFYFNLPLTLLLYLVFHKWIKLPLIQHLPQPLFIRFKSFLVHFNYHKNSKEWLIIILSALIGVFSHLLWDGFTHKVGLFGYSFSFLNQKQNFMGFNIYRFVYLQFISSVIGGIYIIYYIYKLPKSKTTQQTNIQLYWIITSLLTVLIILIRNCQTIQQLIATSISASIIALLISSLIAQKIFKN